jgi:hypothetical protein
MSSDEEEIEAGTKGGERRATRAKTGLRQNEKKEPVPGWEVLAENKEQGCMEAALQATKAGGW